MNIEKYLGETALKEKPRKKLTLVIKDGTVTTAKLSDDAITTGKIADGSITTDKLVAKSITSDKLAEGSVTNGKLSEDAILIKNLAQEIWDKLKDEYLRRDGTTYMNGDIDLNNNSIVKVKCISTKETKGTSTLPSTMIFQDGEYEILFGKYYNDSGDNIVLETYGGINDGNLEMKGDMQAHGFKTKDRTLLGLLNNNAEVVLALSDTEIDVCFTGVFTDKE